MNRMTDRKYLAEDQYRDPGNLRDRAQLHARFSVNPRGWLPWVFDRFAYVRSTGTMAPNPNKLDGLRDAAALEIERNGCLRLAKNTGVFEAIRNHSRGAPPRLPSEIGASGASRVRRPLPRPAQRRGPGGRFAVRRGLRRYSLRRSVRIKPGAPRLSSGAFLVVIVSSTAIGAARGFAHAGKVGTARRPLTRRTGRRRW